MRFAENNRISHRQLYRQMILALLAPFMLCIFGKGGINGISAVTGTVLALILLGFYVILLIRLTPAFDDLVKSAGGFVGRLIGIFFLLYVLLAGGYLLALLRYLVPASLITGVSGRWIAFWAIVACSLGTYKGMQRRGRMAEVSGGLLLGGIVIMLALCVPQAKAEYFMEALQWNEVTGKNIRQSFYGILCAFSAVALLPFLMGDVEKYGSAGKTAAGAIMTLGVLLIGMELLLPAVLGYDRIKAESYPVLPLLDGADLPGNVLARFDIIWMGFLLYSLLFAIGSLLHYGHQIIRKAHLGTGRLWMPVVIFLISLLEENGNGILNYFGWILAYVFVPGILICQVYLFFRGKERHKNHRKKAPAVVAGILALSFFLGGCGVAVEPEKRIYPMALGMDASPEGILLSYGMPDMSESTGQGKEEEDGGARLLQISGSDFTQIEQAYDRSQEKLLDMGHLQVLVIGQTLVEDGRWRMVLDYLKQEAFVGEDLYVFEAENAAEILNWQGEDNSSVGEYISGLLENRMSGGNTEMVTLRELFYEKYKEDKLKELPYVNIRNGSINLQNV
jgi:spore germination protein KB